VVTESVSSNDDVVETDSSSSSSSPSSCSSSVSTFKYFLGCVDFAVIALRRLTLVAILYFENKINNFCTWTSKLEILAAGMKSNSRLNLSRKKRIL
jgi:hypothetical protein